MSYLILILKCSLVFSLLVVLFILFSLLFPPILFDGESMCPTYDDHEVVRGTRLFNKKKFKVGHIYVYERTDDYGQTYIVIKRLSKILINSHGVYLYFLGDNTKNSTDSRDYGYVSSDKVIAKVLNPRKKKEGENNEENKCA